MHPICRPICVVIGRQKRCRDRRRWVLQYKHVFAVFFIYLEVDYQGGVAVGCVEQIGWLCAGAILWAYDYDMPEMVEVTETKCILNEQEGYDQVRVEVDMVWDDARKAKLKCGFAANGFNQLQVIGTKASIEVENFVMPEDQKKCNFTINLGCNSKEQAIALDTSPEIIEVNSKIGQEQLMWEKICNMVKT
eukprot:TRINITY_DN5128_c0_g2_i3.p3 TRINITY_DN5128_c0_g2~~TRINITY_DN5128_c0_g2_i3.p3  ORF type:complete len:191 (+),score=24.62 TRINITY_DN5128_c0_g2_i3:514-1086(+)